MEVLNEILKWSANRPSWQRDALRRLMLKGNLDQEDIDELLDLCKATHGLSEKNAFVPVEAEHVPAQYLSSDPVLLHALTHESGVNALANNQTIKFGPTLTVVYGQNAAGKSGYTRVLKKACRARGSEDILGNVLSETIPTKPSATLLYSNGGTEQRWSWTDANPPHPILGNISVFDRHCATVYLSQRTDVAFRPFGLDLFDKLAGCCEKLRLSLEKARQELTKKTFSLSIPPSTKAYSLISNLTALTDTNNIKTQTELSKEELAQLKRLKRQIHELGNDDTSKTRKEIELKLKRLRKFRESLAALGVLVSKAKIQEIVALQEHIAGNEKLVKKLEAEFEKQTKLDGVGSEEWQAMWNAAIEFSAIPYPTHEFPVVKKGSLCVLCQQELDKNTIDRLNAFNKFMTSTVQTDLEDSREQLDSIIGDYESAIEGRYSNSETLNDIAIDDQEIAETITKNLQSIEQYLTDLIKTLEGKKRIDTTIPKADFSKLQQFETDLDGRLKGLVNGTDKSNLQKLQQEVDELEARKTIHDNFQKITDEVERLKQIAVYGLCLNDVGTTAITKKSTEITKEVVTEKLITAFHDELKELGFDHLEIDLQPSGASRGALYHKLVIKRAANIEVQSVVSEGEARALSIAAFFAELSTASNRSAILFDDPVSSLDHVWRERIAARLVKEAKLRQVIVFTHDIVFLTSLNRLCKESQVSSTHQYIHREHDGAGVSTPDLPWVAMGVKDRIGVLNKKLQELTKIERTVTKEQYEKEAAYVYGMLRETWERGLEEVLIGGIVERYRPSVQSQKIKILADITPDDCTTFDKGMAKCSRWLPGHDNSGAEVAPFPNSAELKTDIESLENWVKEINKRRNK